MAKVPRQVATLLPEGAQALDNQQFVIQAPANAVSADLLRKFADMVEAGKVDVSAISICHRGRNGPARTLQALTVFWSPQE